MNEKLSDIFDSYIRDIDQSVFGGDAKLVHRIRFVSWRGMARDLEASLAQAQADVEALQNYIERIKRHSYWDGVDAFARDFLVYEGHTLPEHLRGAGR